MKQSWMSWTNSRLSRLLMPCRRAHGLLEEYARGDLPTPTEDAVAEHLSRCATCQTDYETMFTIRCVLDTYPRIAASSDFNRQVWNRVVTRRMPAPSRLDRLDNFFARPLYKLAGSTALGLALAGFIVGLILLPGFSSRETGRTPMPNAPSAIAAAGGDRPDLQIAAAHNLATADMTGSYADWMRALQRNSTP